jgi:uncharacterized protein (DUF2384 family)
MDLGNQSARCRIDGLRSYAKEIFGDTAAAEEWLKEPNTTFQDRRPIDLADTESGYQMVRSVLNAIASDGLL